MKTKLIIMLILVTSISFAQNTGIGTITPTEKLDVATGNVRIRNINTSPGAIGTDKTIVADANGVLKTVTTTNSLTAVNGNLISTVNGLASTPAVPILATASNGLNAVGADVRLGGTLSAPTTIVTSAANTLALTGLQNATTSVGTVVTDASGVLKIKNGNNMSAVRGTGSVSVTDNQYFFINNTTPVTETFDNLNEFSLATFTASQAGLYQVSFSVNFAQHATQDYLGRLQILTNASGSSATLISANTKVTLPEASSAVNNTVSVTDLVKLTAGQIIQFQVATYQAAAGGTTTTFTFSITRVD